MGSVLGKISAIGGYESDGTPFNDIDAEKIKDELEKLGYHRSGKEHLYNGMTGKKMDAMIFIGPTYYQRLKHLVDEKLHSRSRGPRKLLTRQPPEGAVLPMVFMKIITKSPVYGATHSNCWNVLNVFTIKLK